MGRYLLSEPIKANEIASPKDFAACSFSRDSSRGPRISELAALIDDREVSPDQLFTFVHIAMSTTIDELSLDSRVGVNTEPWPQACQLVRRSAFDVLGAWTTRLMHSPQHSAISKSGYRVRWWSSSA